MLKIIGLKFVSCTGTYISIEANSANINEAISVVKSMGIVKGLISDRGNGDVLATIGLDGNVSILPKSNIETIYYKNVNSSNNYEYTFCGYVLEEEDNVIKWVYSNFSDLDNVYSMISSYGFSDGFILHNGLVEVILDEDGLFSIDTVKKLMKSMEV